MDIHKEISAKGVSTVVQIQVVNPTNERQTVPNFGIDGKTESKVYSGNRAEAAVVLDPGEKSISISLSQPIWTPNLRV